MTHPGRDRSPREREFIERVSVLCAELPEVDVGVDKFGHTYFKVRGKSLALVGGGADGQGSLSIKADPVTQDLLVRRGPYVRTPYIGQHGWVTLWGEAEIDWAEVEELLRDAYRMAAPKSLVRRVWLAPLLLLAIGGCAPALSGAEGVGGPFGFQLEGCGRDAGRVRCTLTVAAPTEDAELTVAGASLHLPQSYEYPAAVYTLADRAGEDGVSALIPGRARVPMILVFRTGSAGVGTASLLSFRACSGDCWTVRYRNVSVR